MHKINVNDFLEECLDRVLARYNISDKRKRIMIEEQGLGRIFNRDFDCRSTKHKNRKSFSTVMKELKEKETERMKKRNNKFLDMKELEELLEE
jgi:hypothetical protein